jgi:hypothetical protein
VSGTARPGRSLTCATPGYVPEPGATISYSWKRLTPSRGGRFTPPRSIAEGRRYTVTGRDRHHRVACFADAANDGGFVSVGAASVLVRG